MQTVSVFIFSFSWSCLIVQTIQTNLICGFKPQKAFSLFKAVVKVVSVAPLPGLSVTYTQPHPLMGRGGDFMALTQTYVFVYLSSINCGRVIVKIILSFRM